VGWAHFTVRRQGSRAELNGRSKGVGGYWGLLDLAAVAHPVPDPSGEAGWEWRATLGPRLCRNHASETQHCRLSPPGLTET
jgi:hypothetical protein